jgi:hypothetical protein
MTASDYGARLARLSHTIEVHRGGESVIRHCAAMIFNDSRSAPMLSAALRVLRTPSAGRQVATREPGCGGRRGRGGGAHPRFRGDCSGPPPLAQGTHPGARRFVGISWALPASPAFEAFQSSSPPSTLPGELVAGKTCQQRRVAELRKRRIRTSRSSLWRFLGSLPGRSHQKGLKENRRHHRANQGQRHQLPHA